MTVAWITTAGQRRDLRRIQEALESFLRGEPEPAPISPQSPVAAGLFSTVNRFTGTQTGSGSIRDLWLQELAEAAASEERNRLARELHDSIKQQIFSIKMSAAATDARWDSDRPGARKSLEDVRTCAHQAMVEMQALLLQLRPEALANTGLVEALKEQCEALEYRSGAKVHCEFGSLPDESELPPTTQQTLFRIAQEALSNVSRHARASQVTVRLWQEDESLYLAVEDDGQGFEVETAEGGFGLQGMRERLEALSGVLKIRSAEGEGTRLLVQVPFVEEPSVESLAGEQAESAEAGSVLPSGSEGFFSPAVLLGLCAAWLPGITPRSLYGADEERLLSGTLLCVLLAAAVISFGWHRWKRRRNKFADPGDSTPFRLRIFLLLSAAYWWAPQFWWADARQDLWAILGSLTLGLALAGLSTVALFRAIRSAFPRWVQRGPLECLVLLVPWLLQTVGGTAIIFSAYSWKLFMIAMAGGLMTSALYLGFVALVWVERRAQPGVEHED
ncbi:MAG: sensor histidine kinase [Acidobacteriota bacterium]|nr:sensor histidine kinase [Acidobacteriota bacterium]